MKRPRGCRELGMYQETFSEARAAGAEEKGEEVEEGREKGTRMVMQGPVHPCWGLGFAQHT